ncbi:methionyl-tRNA formyltransferase [Terribacillus sp. 179-K 1B1 HS]|uniref:methionyl-tRNA formyltransferase n=1 Tax=Terribacillus sp. 179-K 1B1 HS TaxID=3142388 RepID=UPI00399FF527
MKRIVFMGTPDFAVPVLKQLTEEDCEVVLVVTQPDRPKGRKRILTSSPVKEEALKHGIPVYQPEKIKESFEEIFSYEPDLIVTAAFGQILPKALLDYPQYGCINVHASLLPELRGGAPIHYAIQQGKAETGVTIMYMVEKLDAGDMLLQRSVPITLEDHVGTMHDKLAVLGAEMIHDILPDIFARNVTPIKQDEDKVTFAPTIKREQEVIDWSRSNWEVFNHIRGMHPWPVAFTTYKDKPFKIWGSELLDQKYDGEPGVIAAIESDGIVVVCGNNKAVKLTQVQPAGKKQMTAADYLRGVGKDMQAGERLGQHEEV